MFNYLLPEDVLDVIISDLHRTSFVEVTFKYTVPTGTDGQHTVEASGVLGEEGVATLLALILAHKPLTGCKISASPRGS